MSAFIPTRARRGARAPLVMLGLLSFAGQTFANDRPGVKIITFKAEYADGSANAVDYTLGIPGVTKAQIITEAQKDKKGKLLPKTEGKTFDQVTVRDEKFGGTNGVTLFFRSSAGAVIPKAGGSDTFQIVINDAPARLPLPRGTSTFRRMTTSGNIPDGDWVELAGFKVVNDPEYSITNDFFEADRFAFVVRDLQFLVDVPPVSDTSVFLDFSNSYGFGPSQPDVFVGATDLDSVVFPVPTVQDENWFFARGRLFVGDVEVGRFVQGEGLLLIVPEPTAAVLLISSALAMLALMSRRRR